MYLTGYQGTDNEAQDKLSRVPDQRGHIRRFRTCRCKFSFPLIVVELDRLSLVNPKAKVLRCGSNFLLCFFHCRSVYLLLTRASP